MNGAIKRSNSPTSSDGSKENVEEDNNNLGLMMRYPCPICKQAFHKMKTVYKHLSVHHNKTKEQYLKLAKTIRNNAYIVDNEDKDKEEAPKFHFHAARNTEDALQLAVAVGLVNRHGVGMQK